MTEEEGLRADRDKWRDASGRWREWARKEAGNRVLAEGELELIKTELRGRESALARKVSRQSRHLTKLEELLAGAREEIVRLSAALNEWRRFGERREPSESLLLRAAHASEEELTELAERFKNESAPGRITVLPTGVDVYSSGILLEELIDRFQEWPEVADRLRDVRTYLSHAQWWMTQAGDTEPQPSTST